MRNSEQWNMLHISDKNNVIVFVRSASPLSTLSEIKNLKQHLQQAKRHPQLYKFLDIDSAFIVLNGERYVEATYKFTKEDDDLLAELGV